MNNWTLASETLPDDDALVLVALNDDDVWPAFRNAGAWHYVDATPILHERVTHWMRMPAPPARQAEERIAA